MTLSTGARSDRHTFKLRLLGDTTQLRGVQRHARFPFGDAVECLLPPGDQRGRAAGAAGAGVLEVTEIRPRGRRAGLHDTARSERRVEAGPDGRP